MDRFLQKFRDTILLFCFVALLFYGNFNLVFIIVVSTFVGVILFFITPEETNKIRKIFSGKKTFRTKKTTRRNKKL